MLKIVPKHPAMYKHMHITTVQGLGWWKEKYFRFRRKSFLMTWFLAATTIGDEGTPSERNMGLARHRNPAESGQLEHLAILEIELTN